MRRVILESPYSAPTAEGVERNLTYARECIRDCLKRGEAPLASHLLYTQPGILDDTIPDERRLGMESGFAWTAVGEAVVVYLDLGLSRGMQAGIGRGVAYELTIEPRWIRPIEAIHICEIGGVISGERMVAAGYILDAALGWVKKAL